MKKKEKIMGIVRWAVDFFSQTGKNHIPVFAANAAFFIIIAVFPAVMVLLTILQYTPLTTDDLIAAISNLIPSSLMSFAETMINDLFTRSSGAILSIAAVTAIWSASRGVQGVLIGLNAVYDVDDTRNSIVRRLISVIYMVGILAAILLSLALHVFGTKIYEFIAETFPSLTQTASLIVSFRTMILVVVLTVIFCVIYKVFPNKRLKYLDQLPGAVVAALGWMLFSYFFGIYVDNFSNYSYVYGSLTTIVVAMLWLYTCMMILLMGGAINSFIEKKK